MDNKYYEVYADTYWGSAEHVVLVHELKVEKETPRQVLVTGSKIYKSRFNVNELGKLHESSIHKCVVVKGEENIPKAIETIRETTLREINALTKKLSSLNTIVKELNKLG